MNFIDNVVKTLDKKEIVISLCLDLSKAFDSLDHSILLCKLEHCGIRGILLQWFLSYLSNRKQYVIIDDIKSELKEITRGLPRISILGPCKASKNMINVLFADDTTLYMSHSD